MAPSPILYIGKTLTVDDTGFNFGNATLIATAVPTNNTDITNKLYVDGVVATEAAARISAVSTEAGTRAADDATLTTAVSNEVSARISAVSTEAGTRATNDTVLLAKIDMLFSHFFHKPSTNASIGVDNIIQFSA
jgi:hypothetical protein